MFVVYEPLCVGPEHVEFNSALLLAAGLAFPADAIVFFAEETHLALVKARLGGAANVRFEPVKGPPRLAAPLVRFWREVEAHLRLARFVERHGARGLLFSSMTSEGLFALKMVLWFRPVRGCEIGMVFHAILESLAHRPRRNPLARLVSLRNALGFPSPVDLKYVVLAKLFADDILRRLPQLSPHVVSIEHPYIFPSGPTDLRRFPAIPVRFGTVGAAKLSKGAADWGGLAHAVRDAVGPAAAEFVHVGLVVDAGVYDVCTEVRFVTREGWTDRDAFERELEALDFVVFLYRRDTYRLTASGALMDAFAFAKPLLSLRNPYFEHCFELMGDIGYLCDSIDELRDRMVELVRNPDPQRFLRQRENIVRNRALFAPQRAAETLAAAWPPAREGA